MHLKVEGIETKIVLDLAWQFVVFHPLGSQGVGQKHRKSILCQLISLAMNLFNYIFLLVTLKAHWVSCSGYFTLDPRLISEVK